VGSVFVRVTFGRTKTLHPTLLRKYKLANVRRPLASRRPVVCRPAWKVHGSTPAGAGGKSSNPGRDT
jgi:hypothetical protein